MSNGYLSRWVKESWEREWSRIVQTCGPKTPQVMMQTCPSPAMIDAMIDLVAEDPSRPATEFEPVIHRMLFENQFVDDNGDSVVLDAFDCIELQTRVLVKILEEARQNGVRDGIWSTAPLAPMMFG